MLRSTTRPNVIIHAFGDDRLRRKRLVPECEPSGADLVNSAQNLKCQSHFICCSARRCISDEMTAMAPCAMRPPASSSTWGRTGRNNGGVLRTTLLSVLKTSRWLPGYQPAGIPAVKKSAGYARRFSRVESFGRGFFNN